MNRVVHFEIHASEPEKLKKFYTDVFGWEMQQLGAEYGNYIVIKNGPGMDELDQLPKNPGINGGMMKRNAPLPPQGIGPNAFVCIIAVDNLDAYIEKATTAGGTMHMEKMPVPGIGQLAYFADPDGNMFGMLQPEQHPMG